MQVSVSKKWSKNLTQVNNHNSHNLNKEKRVRFHALKKQKAPSMP